MPEKTHVGRISITCLRTIAYKWPRRTLGSDGASEAMNIWLGLAEVINISIASCFFFQLERVPLCGLSKLRDLLT